MIRRALALMTPIVPGGAQLKRRLQARRQQRVESRSLVFNPSEVYWNQSYGTALAAVPNGKIVVFGLPKSGNVWMKSLIADYFDLPGVEPVRDLEHRGVGICHWAFRDDFLRRADFLHAVCLVRDVRDVVASYFPYSQTPRFLAARPEFHYRDVDSFYYEWFLSRMVTTYRWSTHSAEYAAMGVPVVRYERLWTDPSGELERLIRRWGLEVDHARIQRVVDQNSLERLQQTGKHLDVSIPPDHFRKGGSGSHRDELPPHIIDDINERFAEFLFRWGYRGAR